MATFLGQLELQVVARRSFITTSPFFSQQHKYPSQYHHHQLPVVQCCSDSATINSRVLILGATGRVGGSTAHALSRCCPHLRLLLAGRNREKGESLSKQIGERAEFVQIDIEDTKVLREALENADLVVHAAGPFQGSVNFNVLEAAIATKTAYVDVCDDKDYSQLAKTLCEKARMANVPAIVSAGIYPGVSNVMAAQLVHLAKMASTNCVPERLQFSYFTAGSGGAGPTILTTSYLLLGQDVVAYRNGEKVTLKPYSGRRSVDFGKKVGRRDVYLLNLPEVTSCHQVLGVPTVSARFGTAPNIWNWAMSAIANYVPKGFLKDESKVSTLVKLSNPFVRAVDGFVGELMSIRVDLESSDGRKAVGLYTHKKLSESVGISTAAFARAILEGSTQPGVWFPEECEGISMEARDKLLKRAAEGAIDFTMNKSPWMIEGDPKEVGFGIFLQ